ncbi:hypothetical protein [Methylobacterium brachythecii]|uniref:Uncharacterized protein n=1 Tax=Methylobacterium brachythecii TaxID=1176177 RepID=A0A7W6AMP1_9HYPH|nr:hypothetical protein [Methylobacterium brachythecii]MBB3905441.1 hypothetical protein [Methylobacterium brachythecii]
MSEPEGFISETWQRRFVRRYGWLIWLTGACGLLGIGAVTFLANRQRPPAEQSQTVALQKTNGPSTSAPTPAPAPVTTPAPAPAPAPAKSDFWTPWKAADYRRVVEEGKPIPEQVVDLPPPVLEAPNEPPAAAPEDAPPASTGTTKSTEQADAAASLPATPETTGPSGEDGVSNTESLLPSDKIKEADRYLGRGQITIARYIYEEAFKAGDVLGAIGMARSYDPAYLKSIRSRAVGQTEKAALWYARAAEMSARVPKRP